MLALELIEDFARYSDFKDEWSQFARTMPGLTPFQLPEWLITWWSHFGNGRLHVLVFRENGNVVAIIPCFDHQWNGRRQRTLIGSGISDYLEPPISSGHQIHVLGGIRRHLEVDRTWEVCEWQDLSGDTPLKTLELEGDMDTSGHHDQPCSEIRLTGSFEDFWRNRPKDLRQNYQRDKKRAEGIGKLELAVTGQADPELLKSLIQLHGARWKRRGEAGTIASNGSEGFISDVAAQFAKAGTLQLFSLCLAGNIAAVILGFFYTNSLFFYLSGFDPKYENLGVGRILLHHAIRECFEKRYDAWNFLRGNERYKFHWGAQSIAKWRLIVKRGDSPGAL